MTGRAQIDEAVMVAMYQAGNRVAVIADHFGVKSPAVTRRLNLAGIKPRRKKAVCEDDLAELVADGFTLSDASVELGLSALRITQMWKRICRSLGRQAQ